MDEIPLAQGPQKIVVTNHSEMRLAEMKKLHAASDAACDAAGDAAGDAGFKVDYHLCPDSKDNDRVVAGLPEGSDVVNATGLGKDAPGSPLSDAARFAQNGFVWEFNYRGDLVFLDQARTQQSKRNLIIEDGWVYFIHGFTGESVERALQMAVTKLLDDLALLPVNRRDKARREDGASGLKPRFPAGSARK